MDKLTVGFRETKAYEKAAAFCRRNGLFPAGSRVLVALSGGADSVFALYLLCVLGEEDGLRISSFHLNHMIRGEEADRDEEFCTQLCRRLNVPLTVVRKDIPAMAREEGLGEESMGRRERYAYMDSVRDRFERCVTAHHMDDSAESILMHIIRGSGLRGLKGIAPLRDGWIARPLLALSKEEIVSALEEAGIGYVTDSTNALGEYSRNRIRLEVMPVLERENPRIREALMRLSETASDYLETAESESRRVRLSAEGEEVKCSFDDARSLSSPARFALVSRAASMLGKGTDITYRSIRDLSEMMDSPSTVWRISLAGMECIRSYSLLVFSSGTCAAEGFAEKVPLEIPGSSLLPSGGAISCSFVQKIEKNPGEGMVTFVDYDKIIGLPFARARAEGDSFTPVGMKGTKSVRRFFIDRKLPAGRRDTYPLICDDEGIAAIPGMACAGRCRVDENTRRILRIEYSDRRGYGNGQ